MQKISSKYISKLVKIALHEDLNSSEDITSLLIPITAKSSAQIVTREKMVLCGVDFVNEVFNQLNAQIKIDWYYEDAAVVPKNKILCQIKGPARMLVTGERTALNFLQMLSGIATQTHKYVELIKDTNAALLDTRKTIPGLRLAEKYAVRCGGGQNHRMGLYDAFLIKENHIIACGSISKAIANTKKIAPRRSIEVEVENTTELKEAINAGANIVMLDNFTVTKMIDAVRISNKKAKLEVSGNVTRETISEIAKTGVDYISVGDLTKNIRAIDLSMRFLNDK